jgi:hypothetical protein
MTATFILFNYVIVIIWIRSKYNIIPNNQTLIICPSGILQFSAPLMPYAITKQLISYLDLAPNINHCLINFNILASFLVLNK